MRLRDGSERVTSEILDRQPPFDLNAEMALLGSIILSPACLDDIGTIKAADFYDDANGTIYQAARDMHDAGRRMDVELLRAEITKSGNWERIGGMAYFARIVKAAPNAAHAVYYAKNVKEASTLRNLIDCSTETLRDAYEARDDANELLDRAEAKLYSIRDKWDDAAPVHITESLHAAIDRLEQRMDHGIIEGTIRTGFTDLDAQCGGFHDAELTIIAARPSMGKAQPLDARVLTPGGFVAIGSLQDGSLVIGSDGLPHVVTGVYPQGARKVYRVTMCDGTKTRCCEEHLWNTQTRTERRRGGEWSVKTTAEIAGTLVRDGGGDNHAIPVIQPVEFGEDRELPIQPYALGLYLGDGTSSGSVVFHNTEDDLKVAFGKLMPDGDFVVNASDGITNRVNGPGFKSWLKYLGLCGKISDQKFIPSIYLFASVEDRRALLRGLCDTDGFVITGGQSIEYTTASRQLADDVLFLVRSLGGIANCTQRPAGYLKEGKHTQCKDSYRLRFWFPCGFVPVASKKHWAKWNHEPHANYKLRKIHSVDECGIMECVCIAVDAPDSLYVTDDFIVTHNTAFAMNLMHNIAKDTKAVAFFSLEMSNEELADRLLVSASRVNGHRLRAGTCSREDRQAIVEAAGTISQIPIFIDDKACQTVNRIAGQVRRLQRKHDLSLVIIDYLQLIEPADGRSSRQEQVAQMARRLKMMAKEFSIPVVCLCQLNRQGEETRDHIPKLSHLRESGAIEQDADNVWFVHREEYYRRGESADEVAGKAEIIVAKQRNGPTGSVELVWRKEYMRFEDKAPERLAVFDNFNTFTEQSQPEDDF